MEVEIRPMIESDVPRILEIENLCFIAPFKEKDILYELNENKYCLSYTALIDGVVVGFALVYALFDQASIVQIATHPDYQKQGVGSKIIDKIYDDCYAKRINIITLEVRENNDTAHKFYLKHGYKDVLLKERYYSNGDNAIYMTREITL